MTVERVTSEEKIDIYCVVEILWQGIWVILVSSVLFLVLSISLLSPAAPVYNVSVNVGPSLVPKSNLYCHVEDSFISDLGIGWSLDKKCQKLTLTTKEDLSADEYAKKLAQANEKMTSRILLESERKLRVFELLPQELKASEIAVSNFIQAKGAILAIEENVKAYTLSVVSIKKSDKAMLRLIVAALFGAMIGAVIVLFRDVIRNRKKAG